MKKFFVLLTCVFSIQEVYTQTNKLPRCDSIREKLAQINQSFDRLVEKFATGEDKISLIKTYFTGFTICEEKGKIKDYGRNIDFIFIFSDAVYTGGRHEFRDFYKKIFKRVREEFRATHIYKVSKEKSAKSSYFFEKGKEIAASKTNIKLSLAYKDPVDEATAYSVSLVFEYYRKR